MPVVDADAGLDRNRNPVAVRGAHGAGDDLTDQIELPGQHSAAAFAGDLGHRAAKVQIDVVDPETVAQDVDGDLQRDGVDAVGLHRAHVLFGPEGQHVGGLRVPDHQPAGRDHLADVQPRALLAAQLPIGRIRHSCHGREDDRGVDHQRVRMGRRTQPQFGQQPGRCGLGRAHRFQARRALQEVTRPSPSGGAPVATVRCRLQSGTTPRKRRRPAGCPRS